MNRNNIKIKQAFSAIVILIALLATACKKEQIPLFSDDSPAIYMGTTSYSYSFIDDKDANSKTIYLAVKLSGEMADHDRSFKMEAVFDSTTTAKAEWFEIQEGILPKNSVEGRIPIVLKRNATIDTSLVDLTLQLIPSSSLGTILNTKAKISWTGKIIQPANWSWMRYYLGADFSTAWYSFIIDVTGRNSFPYQPTWAKTDPETWWMSAGEIQGWGLMVKDALTQYNFKLQQQYPDRDTAFMHNDGPKKGLPVVFY